MRRKPSMFQALMIYAAKAALVVTTTLSSEIGAALSFSLGFASAIRCSPLVLFCRGTNTPSVPRSASSCAAAREYHLSGPALRPGGLYRRRLKTIRNGWLRVGDHKLFRNSSNIHVAAVRHRVQMPSFVGLPSLLLALVVCQMAVASGGPRELGTAFGTVRLGCGA